MRSSVILLVKRAFQDGGISLPDEAREVIFPNGVPVRMLDGDAKLGEGIAMQPPKVAAEPDVVSTRAEGDLQSEAGQIKEQAHGAWSPEQSENLLADENGDEDAPQR